MCDTSTCPSASLYVTQPYPVLVLQVTNAGGEKAWIRGYATSVLVLAALFSKQVHIVDAAVGDYSLDGQLSTSPFFFSANLTAIS